MKKLLHYLLIILMLIPAMVCAMPCSMDMPHEAGMVDTPSGGHVAKAEMHEKDDLNISNFMLLSDCINSDFDQTQSKTRLEDPVYNSYPVVELLLQSKIHIQFQLSEININRWPPPWALKQESSPHLILTTQRFRI